MNLEKLTQKEFVRKEFIEQHGGKFYGVGIGKNRIYDYIAVIYENGKRITFHKISDSLYKRCNSFRADKK